MKWNIRPGLGSSNLIYTDVFVSRKRKADCSVLYVLLFASSRVAVAILQGFQWKPATDIVTKCRAAASPD